MDCKLKDKMYNNKKVIKMITAAAERGADLIVLPELFNTGYNMDLIGNDWDTYVEDYNGETVQGLCNIASKLKIHICATIAFKNNVKGIKTISSLFINDLGKIIGKHDKIQLWLNERKYFRTGNNLNVFNSKWGKIGLVICYDMIFPEIIRNLVLKGAEIILLSAAWGNLEEWDRILPARAMENTIFIAGTNRVGIEKDLKMFGKSKVINPYGRCLIEAPVDREQLLIKKIDLNDINKVRKELPYLRDIRTEFYNLRQ